MSIYNIYLYKYLAHLMEKNKMNLLIHNEGNMSVFSNPSNPNVFSNPNVLFLCLVYTP